MTTEPPHLGDDLLYTTVESPLGPLLLLGDNRSLCGISLQDGPRPATVQTGWVHTPEPFAVAALQLREYFEGRRTTFELRLTLLGTSFQQDVWTAVETIPYGATLSYADIARRIGRPDAARAVGFANGKNPIPIIVPCHRLVGSDGALTGYGGGIERKRFLLDLEAQH